ncbi:hypothetical protein B0O41_3874 [Propionibacteriaceae bacterium ES.041]|uniref:hypothetical protein n=1 Tax=Enemella evansiae TaxID=2016499 RepID=UPI000C0181CD|nr:hypothetical protein [Enemella evansiae]PFG69024.1 hypothetical protein B0O41_3874 [Propionibacteriaceae bacterium ES.041]
MTQLVVGINPDGQQAYRRFWTGPVGSALLLVPGLVIAVVGVVLLVRDPRGWSLFFAAVVIFSGLYGMYAGWDHRRRSKASHSQPPLAFAIDDEGAVFPRGKQYAWDEVRFVVTDEAEPRLLCSPIGLAYKISQLDTDLPTIELAITEFSAGTAQLERL